MQRRPSAPSSCSTAAWSPKPCSRPREASAMFGNYVAAALGNLRRNGLYSGLIVTGLAVGFASAILIGLYLRHELTYDRFIPGHDRVFLMSQTIVAHDKPKFE